MQGKDMMERMVEVASRTGEPILLQPLVELCSDRRVLIEHHQGIGAYSSEAVNVNVRFGTIRIIGSNLVICKMTADQLVITGGIDAIMLEKGRGR